MIAAEQFDDFRPLRENLSAFLRHDTIHPAVAGGRDRVQEADALAYPTYVHPAAEPDPHGFLSDAALPPSDGACILGVIDDMVPVTHRRLTAGGASRLASVWLQGAAHRMPTDAHAPGTDLAFGRELRGPQIDAMRTAHTHAGTLDEEAMLRDAGILDPARGPLHGGGRRSRHGAAVTDLMAGLDPADPDAARFPVIGVALPPEVTRDTLGTFAPFYILSATLHILHRARRLCRWLEAKRGLDENSLRLPVVINLSYGVTAGPKDGMGLIERFQDAVAAESDDDATLGPVRFVVPTGNHRLSRGYARLTPDHTIAWHIPPDDATPTFAEIWGPVRASLSGEPMQLTLTTPGGTAARTAFTAHDTVSDLSTGTTHLARCYLSARRARDGGWREAIVLALPPTASQTGRPTTPAGRWGLSVHGTGPFDLHVQRDDSIRAYRSGGRQSRLDDGLYRTHDPAGRVIETDPPEPGPLRRAGTVNAYACGSRQVRVAGTTRDDRPMSYSARTDGPDGLPQGTDLSAIADWGPGRRGVPAAGAYVASLTWMSGTSAAAPQIARALARHLAQGNDPAGPLDRPPPALRRFLREW